MKHLRILLSFLFCFGLLTVARSTEPFIVFQQTDGTLCLDAATVGCDDKEHSCVQRALQSLCSDFERVTGYRPARSASPRILVGTVGVNSQITQWVREGVISDLQGKTEKYVIQTIADQLVIAGSDKRGTVFGIYELTRQLGVSPWYWWADVPVEHRDHLYALRGSWTDGEPAVRWRGIFLNDEGPCLMQWVKNTYGTSYGDHRFYERVFELILRLKGNFLWPAMWAWAFYADDPQNSSTADSMGVMIGTSHHEPMARNHQEWARHRREFGAWNYRTNQQVIDRFFRQGIERMKNTEDIVTIGMRGDGDEAMSDEADTRLLENIVKNQRKIIRQVTGRPAEQTPQVWALYKEVLDYYDKGMRVPDDVTILLCDDNWGNVRRVPTAEQRRRPGGWGLYYHVDYVGAPRNSKWLNATPSQNMWEQLTLAYDNGIDRLWILNVGDLKPMEYPISLFMDMAWSPRSVGRDVVATHTRAFCAQQFGEQEADEAARILNRACKLNGRSTAEMLDATTYNLQSGEWQEVADAYMRLETEALRQFVGLPASYADAYRQLILFPVQAMSNLHQMYYAQAMNHHLAAQHDPEANLWAQRVRDCFRRDSLLCASYNHDLAGGKWNGMMIQKHIGYTSWNDDFPAERLPEVRTVPGLPSSAPSEGYVFTARDGYVAIEAEHCYEVKHANHAAWTVLPDFGRTQSALTLMPYTQPTDGAELAYRFSLGKQQPDQVRVHIITKSTLDYLNQGGLTFDVALDSGTPQRVNFNAELNEQPENIHRIYYPTIARRVVESVVTLPLSASEEHLLTLHPNDPAIVFEKIVIDAGGYQPQYLFGRESPKRRLTDWVGTWATAPEYTGQGDMPRTTNLSDCTLRQIVSVSIGADSLRLQFSNEFGSSPVELKAVYIADATDSCAIAGRTLRALRFGGSSSVTIEPGKTVFSDPLVFRLRPLQRLAVTQVYGAAPEHATSHRGSRTTSYIMSGEWHPGQPFVVSERVDHWYNLSAIDVLSASAPCVAILGNSITDGRGSTTNAQNRWPDALARALGGQVAVLNLGIGGNCLVEGGLSQPGRQRFDRDILGQRGLTDVVLFEGVNDIGGSSAHPDTTAQRLISTIRELTAKAHRQGLRVHGATITPIGRSMYWSAEHEAARQAVNRWIRETDELDGFIDFDLLVRDPDQPTQLQESLSNDWLHLNPAGYDLMGRHAAQILFR